MRKFKLIIIKNNQKRTSNWNFNEPGPSKRPRPYNPRYPHRGSQHTRNYTHGPQHNYGHGFGQHPGYSGHRFDQPGNYNQRPQQWYNNRGTYHATPGHGIEYEIFAPAFFALQLNNDDRVRDFSIRSNVSTEFGKFDDVVIDVTLQDNTTMHFAFQLKHKEKKCTELLPTSFEEKGDFNLEKYYQSFKGLQDDKKNRYHFILYTNAQFDKNKCEEVVNFTMSQDNKDIRREFFDTSATEGNVYKFEVNSITPNDSNMDRNIFQSKLRLYTCQKNFQDLEKEVEDILGNEEVTHKFFELFRKWHQGRFNNKVINRKTINIHLIDAFLSHHCIRNYYPKLQFFEEIINEFDITVMRSNQTDFDKIDDFHDHFKNVSINELEYGAVILKRRGTDQTSAIKEWILRMAKEYKIIEKTAANTDEDTTLKVIFYFLKKMIIVDFNQTSKNLFCQTMVLYNMKQMNLKFLLLVRNTEFPTIPNMKIFENLEDVAKNNRVLYKQLVQTCKLFFQGQEVILEDFVKHLEEASSVIESNQIFQMLRGNFLVKEDIETLPMFYIPRKVSTYVFNKETVFKYARNTSNLLLINFGKNLDQYLHVFERNGISIIKYEDYREQEEAESQKCVILSTHDYNDKMFETITKKYSGKNIYFLKILTEDSFIITRSNKSIQQLKSELELEETIDDKLIHNIFNTSVNILVGEPGMGKSTMMKYLKNNYTWDIWAINVVLQVHGPFFKENHTTEEVLAYFESLTTNDTFSKNLMQLFENKKKIVIFLDGLDELESSCVDNVLRHAKKFSEMGFCIWISSREHLTEKLETTFGKFGINIMELTEPQQQNYIEDRLEKRYSKEEIQNLTQQIFQSNEYMKNQTTLGIPLQLYIITEILLDSKQHSLLFTENVLVVTKLFRAFFEGRCKHEIRKNTSNLTLFDDCEDYLQRYEIPALETIFEKEILLALKLDLRQSQRFLKKVQTEKDLLGIIVNISSDGRAIFQHQTFAEYFACVFLFNNLDKSRTIKDYLFVDKYQNLLLILNIMSAEKNPLHLAVIYKNVDQIKMHLNDGSLHDAVGRNPLHISVMYGCCKYTESWKPHFYWSEGTSQNILLPGRPVFDLFFSESSDESETNKEILEQLLSKCDPFEKDLLFHCSAFHCAVIKNNIFAIEKILKHHGMSSEAYETLQGFGFVNNPVIVYFATLWKYPNILSVALDKKHSLLTMMKIGYDFTHQKVLDCLWNILSRSESNSFDKNEVALLFNLFGVQRSDSSLKEAVANDDLNLVNFLLENSNNFDKNENHVLWAIFNKNKQMVNYLLSKGFSVNTSSELKSSMHLAVETGEIDMLQFLLTHGGDINTVDSNHNTLLHYASKIGNNDMTIFILNKDVDVNSINKQGKTALHCAVDNNNMDTVRLLLKNGASLMENGNKQVLTPLQSAAKRGFYDMVCLLLENGANEKIRTSDRDTILHLAAAGGNESIATLFLRRGWDVNSKNNKGVTPLFFAVKNKNVGMCKLLLRLGAKTDLVADKGNTLLHWAALGGNCEILDMLLQKIKNINAENYYKQSPMYVAARNGHVKAVKLFIEAGAKINLKTLMNILKTRSFYLDFGFLIEKMVEDGADPNCKINGEQETLLSKAIRSNNFELAKFLLKHGANVNDMKAFYNALCCHEWKKLLELLFSEGLSLSNIQYKPIYNDLDDLYGRIKLLLDYGVEINLIDVLHSAATHNNYHLVNLCLQNGTDINVKDSQGRTATLKAASVRNFDMMKYLLEKGGDPNCRTINSETIWWYVMKYSNKDFLQYLLTKEIDPNIKGINDETPLYLALKRNDQEIIQSLIQKGARFDNLKLLYTAVEMNNFSVVKIFFDTNKNMTIHGNERILLKACSNGNCEIIQYLLKRGFEVNTVNNQNETGLLLAAKNKEFDAVKLMVLRGADVNCISKGGETIWKHIQYCEQNLKKLIYSRNVDLSLENTKKKTPLYYAIKNEDIFILEELLRGRSIVLDMMSWNEAFLCQNSLMVNLLEEKTNYDRAKKFQTSHDLNAKHSPRSNCRFGKKTNIDEAQDDIYRMLHFAVYTGDVNLVRELLDKYIDVNHVDIYNDLYPLHFAVNNRRLEEDLLIQFTSKIDKLYDEFPKWKLRHMRKYILNSYPVDQYSKQNRKKNYVYLVEEFRKKCL